jgi:hypothetical protein
LADEQDATLGNKGVSGIPPTVLTVPDEYVPSQQVRLKANRPPPSEPQPGEPAPESAPTFDDLRDAIEDQAVQRARARREAESRLAEAGGDPSAVKPPEPEPAAAPEAEPTPTPDKAAEPAPRMLRVKINGVEEMWPEDKVLAAAQKNTAADRNLEKSIEILQTAIQMQRQPGQPESPPEEKPKPVDLNAMADEWAEKFVYGDKDSVKQALLKFAETVSTQRATPTEADIQRLVARHTADSLESGRTSEAWQRLGNAHRDILGDDIAAAGIAAKLHAEMVDDLVKIGGNREHVANLSADDIGRWHKIARTAGYGVRSFEQIGEAAISAVRQRLNMPKPNGTQPSPLASRQEAKRQMVPRPNVASARVPATPPRRKTPQELIAEETAARARR